MNPRDEMVEWYETEVCGVPAIYTDWRIDKEMLPDGLHMYEMRHADDDTDLPCTIETRVVVNFYGTLVTRTEIELPGRSGKRPSSEHRYREIPEWDGYGFEPITLDEFLSGQTKGEE
jgi:hypothetical protein